MARIEYDTALFQCPQPRWPFKVTDELEELWRVECDLFEDGYIHYVESRGIDAGQDLLQIFAGHFEYNFGETGEDKACQRRRTSAF